MLVANIAFLAFPIISIVLFKTLSAPLALLITIFGGYLFLPEHIVFDLPFLPGLNKTTIPALMAFALLLGPTAAQALGGTQIMRGWVPQMKVVIVLLAALFLGVLLTILTNRDPLIFQGGMRPGRTLSELPSNVLLTIILLLPFLMGRKLLATPQRQRLLLLVLVGFGMAYSLLALYEIRMSPQLNVMIYGFFPHSWIQHIRPSGFRPLVFLNHGLWLAIFFFATVMAAITLTRIYDGALKLGFVLCSLWLVMTLSLSNSLGALLIMVLLAPCVYFLGIRGQLALALILCTGVLIFPLLRSFDLVPLDRLLSWAAAIEADRAGSLQFRFDNENILLEKARQRFAFGWGGWAREYVFDEVGQAISVADGYWVIVLGQGGLLRYFAEFGLLCLPTIIAFFSARRYDLGLETSALALILAGCLVDLIPNATVTPWTWLLAGSLWGRLELGRVTELDTLDPNATSVILRYQRQFPKSAPKVGTLPSTKEQFRTSRKFTRDARAAPTSGKSR